MKSDNKYKLYFNLMPQVANEGLLRLMSKGRPKIKTYTLTQNIIENALGTEMMTGFRHVATDITYTTDVAYGYYFEADNTCEVKIYVDGVLASTITGTAKVPGQYTVYKGLITNAADKEVSITFGGLYGYNYRNVALYNTKFENAAAVPNFVPEQKYALKTLITDLYKISSVIFEENGYKSINNTNYILKEDGTLILDSSIEGSWIISYEAYPVKITSSTTDATVIDIPDEMIALLPLYMASELYKDDDGGIAVGYRNQFELELEDLYDTNDSLKFVNNNGWL
jgi:hypothetical protein